MIYSMTGFGSARTEADNLTVLVEIKSVNHRYNFRGRSSMPVTEALAGDRIDPEAIEERFTPIKFLEKL